MSSLKGLIENVPDYLHTKERDGKRIRDALGVFRSQLEDISSTVTGITGGTTDLSGYFKLAGRSSQQAITNNFPARHILYIQPSAAQSGDLIRVRDYTNTYNAFSIDAGSLVTISETTATDDTVRFQIRVPTTQTQNISQVVRAYGGGNYTAWSIGSGGANVFGDNTANGAGVIRLRINQGSGQSVDMFQIRNTADTISLASVDSTARWDIRPVGSGTTIPSLAIRRATAAAAPIQEWQNTSGTALSRIVANGSLVVRVDNAGLNVTGSLSTSFTSVGAAALTTIQTNTTGWSGASVSNGLWRLEPTLSDPGGVGGPGVLDTTMFRINADIDDAASSMIGLQSIVDVSDNSGLSAGACAAIGMDFSAKSSGTGAIGNLVGVQGTTLHDSSGTATNLIGGNFIVRASGGNVTNVYALKPDFLIDSGTVTNFYSLYAGMASISGTGAVTTAYGVYVESKAATGFTTKWSVYVAGGDSSFNGLTTLGSNATPTAYAHLAAGTTAASTAPLKFTSGSLMSAVEAGAEEYDGSYHYLTNSTTRGAIATTGNVVVDLGGDVVTTLDGEVLLAA